MCLTLMQTILGNKNHNNYLTFIWASNNDNI